jgi:hypothetical protein
MTTIRDVAKRLNLAIATVSRALDGYGDVAESTRKLVEELEEHFMIGEERYHGVSGISAAFNVPIAGVFFALELVPGKNRLARRLHRHESPARPGGDDPA